MARNARTAQAPAAIEGAQDILGRIRRIELRTRRLVNSAFAGQYHSVFRGRGMNYEDVREYQPGDDTRSIDWNVTARSGKPHIKIFTEERELTVLLAVDVSASGVFGSRRASKRELAAELAAVLAFSAIHNADKVGALLFTDSVEFYMPPRKGRLHALRTIREILFHNPRNRGTNVSAALEFANRVIARRAVVFLISDFISPDFSKPLGIASRKHDLIAVRIEDPAERELPDAGWITLEDAESGEQYEIDTSSRSVRERYAKEQETQRKNTERLFRSRGIDCIPLATDADYIPALRAFFKARERRLAVRTGT